MSTDPLSRFEAEHQEALGVLRQLENAANALDRDETPAPLLDVIRDAYRFLCTVVREHNETEERALFSLLAESDLTRQFAEEHRRLWKLERELGAALDAPDPARRVPPVALELVEVLRDHIHREDHMLFPHAREVLGPGGLEAVSDRL